ncbi:MAG: potassium channel protein [archaeon GBS-70-058]|nr:potassium channel protein [Candidatus Culexarchaeum nevadense]
MGTRKSHNIWGRRPRTVKEVLVDMKNSCGLMLDLAYASLFLNDEDLAEEVLELERDIDSLLYEIWASASIAVRDVEDAEALTGIMKLAISIDSISNAVADIVNVVRLKLGLPSQLKDALSKIEPQYRRIIVAKESPIAGKKLGELELDVNMGVYVLAIRRGAKMIIDPEDNEVIVEGDILIVRGPIDGLNDLSKIASGEIKDLKEVLEDGF